MRERQCRSAMAAGMLRRLGSVALLLGAIGPAATVEGQVFPEGPLGVQYQFNFSNPGARSLGLAGAFAARANDATAAYANPAGLSQLRDPEVAVEGRQWRYETILRGIADGEVVEIAEQNEIDAASFLSVSYPFERVTLALYRHELANFEVRSGPNALFEESRLDLGITGVGLSAGVRVVDQMSIGVSVVQYDAELDAFQSDPAGGVTMAGDGDEVAFNLGLLWEFTNRFRFAWVVRNGPEFDVAIDRGGREGVDRRTFKVPDVVGFGAAWDATERLVASLDYYLVRYSQTVEGEPVEGGVFGVPDANELRLGLEYTLWQYASAPAFRLGVWNDPPHAVRFKPREETDLAQDLAEVFPSGDDELHLSVGFGMVFSRFQFDAAADFSDTIDTYSLSVAVFF